MKLPLISAQLQIARRFLNAPDQPGPARDLAELLPKLAASDAIWPELAKNRATAGNVSPRRLLIDVGAAVANGDPVVGLRKLALAAAGAPQAPASAFPWDKLRDLLVEGLVVLQAGDSGPKHVWSPPALVALNWAATFAEVEAMPVKLGQLRAAISAATGIPAMPVKAAQKARVEPAPVSVPKPISVQGLKPEGIRELWQKMQRTAASRPNRDVLPYLDALITVPQVPKEMSERLLNCIATLPLKDLLPRLERMRKGPVWGKHRNLITYRASGFLALPGGALQRAVVPETVGAETADGIFVSDAGPADITAIVHCAMGRRPGGLIGKIDACLAQRGIRAIYVFDREGKDFVADLSGLETRAAELRAQIANRPNDRLLMIGYAMNAMPAIGLGLALKARGVLCYSGLVTSDPAARAALGDNRPADFPVAQEMDVRSWVAKAQTRPVIHMHFAPGIPADRAHAQALATCTEVDVLPAFGHFDRWLPAEMMLRGTFAASLDRMIAAL